jgi:hypothetical protein
MRSFFGDRVLEHLAEHVGRENAISAPAIALEMRLPFGIEREVRRTINSERSLWAANGILVCATPGGGYYIAADLADIADYHSTLRALATAAADRLASFEQECALTGFALSALETSKTNHHTTEEEDSQ